MYYILYIILFRSTVADKKPRKSFYPKELDLKTKYHLIKHNIYVFEPCLSKLCRVVCKCRIFYGISNIYWD